MTGRMMAYTQSELETFRRDPIGWYITYYLRKIAPEKNPALDFGTRFHKYLFRLQSTWCLYSASRTELRLEAEELFKTKADRDWAVDQALWYQRKIRGEEWSDLRPTDEFAFEQTLRVSIEVGAAVFQGQIDLLAPNLIVDYKTTGKNRSVLTVPWPSAPQLQTYAWLWYLTLNPEQREDFARRGTVDASYVFFFKNINCPPNRVDFTIHHNEIFYTMDKISSQVRKINEVVERLNQGWSVAELFDLFIDPYSWRQPTLADYYPDMIRTPSRANKIIGAVLKEKGYIDGDPLERYGESA